MVTVIGKSYKDEVNCWACGVKLKFDISEVFVRIRDEDNDPVAVGIHCVCGATVDVTANVSPPFNVHDLAVREAARNRERAHDV